MISRKFWGFFFGGVGGGFNFLSCSIELLFFHCKCYLFNRFDILVNGGGSVTLEFVRDPFVTQTASVLVPWNQIITMDTVIMATESRAQLSAGTACSNLDNNHDHYLLRPVVLSTWQHTQLGACPKRSTIIPESQVRSDNEYKGMYRLVM